MMGGALGGLEAFVLPNEGAGFWPLVSMSAILGGTMRSPFTGIVFGLELTHDVNVLLPLLVAVVVAHGFTVLVLPRSILTEKVSRRGFHLTRDYATDPLERHFVREVMRTHVLALPATTPLAAVQPLLARTLGRGGQRLYPLVGDQHDVVGVISRAALRRALAERGTDDGHLGISALASTEPVVAYPDETLRSVVYRMAETGRTRLPVVERGPTRRLRGYITLTDLLKARVHHLDEERRRERILRMRLRVPFRRASERAGVGANGPGL
jgi:CBS domain-containing protein